MSWKRINLVKRTTGATAWVEWNQDDGTFRGPEARLLTVAAQDAGRDGYVVIPPYPTSFAIKDAAHTADDLAAVIVSVGFSLPDGFSLPSPPPRHAHNAVY